jgi:hypothetical protein
VGFPKGIGKITSVGGTVTITNPSGPVTNLEAAGGALWPVPSGLKVDYEFPGSFASAPVSPAVMRSSATWWNYAEPRPGQGEWSTIIGNGSPQWVAVAVPTPSGNWTFDTNIEWLSGSDTFRGGGAVVEFADGSLITFWLGPVGSGSDLQIHAEHWSNYSTYVGSIAGFNIPLTGPPFVGPVFLRVIKVSATSYTLAYSFDGVNYTNLATGYNPGAADAYAGFGANTQTTSTPLSIAKCNYLRIH